MLLRLCGTPHDAAREAAPLLLLGVISFKQPTRLARRAAIRSLIAAGSSHDKQANTDVAVRFIMAEDEVSIGIERPLMRHACPLANMPRVSLPICPCHYASCVLVR
eukprot:1175640-Prymnesium_polylepis.1